MGNTVLASEQSCAYHPCVSASVGGGERVCVCLCECVSCVCEREGCVRTYAVCKRRACLHVDV